MLRIAKGLLTIVAVATIAVGATSAYFTDSKTVDNNTFTAGTVILNVSPASAVWAMPNMAPGHSVTNSLAVTNGGTLQSSLTASMVFAEADASVNPTPNMTATDVAKELEVTVVNWHDINGTLDLLPHLTNNNGNGWKDLDDFRAALGTLAVLNPGETGTLNMTLQFRNDANNDFQGDGVNATITLTLQNI